MPTQTKDSHGNRRGSLFFRTLSTLQRKAGVAVRTVDEFFFRTLCTLQHKAGVAVRTVDEFFFRILCTLQRKAGVAVGMVDEFFFRTLCTLQRKAGVAVRMVDEFFFRSSLRYSTKQVSQLAWSINGRRLYDAQKALSRRESAKRLPQAIAVLYYNMYILYNGT